MDSIYINNFRGFSNTTIPIWPVNFLLGENSTGKTSILSMLNLFASQEFWYSLNFNIGDYEFGGYQDIVSVDSSNKDEFQIGLYKESLSDKKYSACYMLHFREGVNGLPILHRFTRLCSRYYITMRVENDIVYTYGTEDVPDDFSCLELSLCFEYMRKLSNNKKREKKVAEKELTEIIKKNPIFLFDILINKIFPEFRFDRTDEYFPIPALTNNILASLAPIRTKPKRTYDGYAQNYSSEGDHTPYIIRANERKTGFNKALEDFGIKSGLYDNVGVLKFGKDNAAPFELIVELAKSVSLRINSVGYGVSQALPIVVELLNRPNKTWFAVQQPEVHLHPRAQAALGDVFYNVATTHDKVLFVETHSDYLIDRFRLNYRKKAKKEKFAHILFFERTGGGNKITQVEILPNGEYSEKQPNSFRSFFLEEQRNILGF